MIRKIEIETFLQSMSQGISRPVMALGDDYEEYILKNENIDNNGTLVKYNCMFLNEMLAYQIALYLEIPIPESVIAKVDKELPTSQPELIFAYRFDEGTYFATKKLKEVENNLMKDYEKLIQLGKPYISRTWKNFFSNIANKEDFAKIVAFDILISNFDRYKNQGNILINNKNNIRKIYAIDHGHAFWGPIWNTEKINNLSCVSDNSEYIKQFGKCILSCLPGKVFTALEESVNLMDLNNNPFNDIVQKIKAIDENMIDEWMNNIPDEWYIDKKIEVNYYKKYILKQKEVVQYIIQYLANNDAFTNYRGGILKWNNLNEKFHTV